MEKIMCLSIEIKTEKSKAPQFCFHATMVQALLSGLSTMYSEVFFWSCGKRAAVWVVGAQTDFLVQAFMHHRDKFKTIQLLDQSMAISLFQEITSGSRWPEKSLPDKLKSLYESYDAASCMGTLGHNLQAHVLKGISSLRENPAIAGGKNSWKLPANAAWSSMVRIRSTDLFYRFSIN